MGYAELTLSGPSGGENALNNETLQGQERT